MRKSWKVFVVFTVMATVLAIPGVALAHHPGISYEPDCLFGDLSFEFTYTITAVTTTTPPAEPADLTNPLVKVWISYDGGPLVPQPDGAFALPNNSFSGGPLTAPPGTQTVRILVDPQGTWGDGSGTLGDSRERTFGPPIERCFDNPGTGTPGYWKNHPDAWPVGSITIGGVTYAKAAAIGWMQTPVRGDKTLSMFPALVSAKLNVLIGNDSSCISATIAAADTWMASYGPVGSNVRANSAAWGSGGPLHYTLDQYNNGYLCAPHRD